MATDPERDLTGVWDGVFSYPRGYPPTSFTAVLLDLGATLTGSVHEVATAGAATGQTITALISGSKTAAAIEFTKTYDLQEGDYRQVIYAGQVNGDATQIDGRWNIPGVWSGAFMMSRPRPAAEDVDAADAIVEKIEV